LKKGKDGIWFAEEKEECNYPKEGSDNCFRVEDESFWFQNRNEMIGSLVDRFPPPGWILDIGGGNGAVSQYLAKQGRDTVLLEPSVAGALNARKRGLDTIICASLGTIQLESASVPAVGLFDVLEHIEDDAEFLKQINNVLAPNGILYLTVPAFPVLWSGADVGAGHFRRYTVSSLHSLLEEQGLCPVYERYFFSYLFLPLLATKAIPYKLKRPSVPIILRHHPLPKLDSTGRRQEHDQRKWNCSGTRGDSRRAALG